MEHNCDNKITSIEVNSVAIPPSWALWQRKLFDLLNKSAFEFAAKYTRLDGTLIWKEEWPGMDGSDDSYEGFMNFPLFYVLGGNEEIHTLSRKLWDAFTWQWTAYGQIHREFDAYYDWMHHGESSLFIYYYGLADPTVLKDRQRAIRFAEMYMGDDPESENYDKKLKLIRSPINGSRGPRHEQTAEDWSTHREILDDYPPPFEDIPGVSGATCQWTDDAIYENVLRLINARMAKGDVPLNLTLTSLITNAYLYTGDLSFRNWVFEYLEAWKERTLRNGGITPDNIGLNGEIGENMDGKWWGGYYGWRWPHGSFTIIEPLLIAGSNAALMDGGRFVHLDLARSQMDMLWNLGKKEGNQWLVPNKHLDEGWSDYRPMNSLYPLYCWVLSMDDSDLARLKRIRPEGQVSKVTKCDPDHYKGAVGNNEPWFDFIRGNYPEYPEEIMRINYELVLDQLEKMREDKTDPATWDIHHWQNRTPMILEGLIQLTLGTPMHIYHGGLLHARIRYYDAQNQRPGLPEGVSALVEKLEADSTTLQLYNLDMFVSKQLIIQAGSFSEHTIHSVSILCSEDEVQKMVSVEGKWVMINLVPGAGTRLKLSMTRYSNPPSYETPWQDPKEIVMIKGRVLD